MIDIDITDKELFTKAKNFAEFRDNCKAYLAKVGMNYDKFTVVTHDSYIGYISEFLIRQYIKSRLPEPTYHVYSWEEYQKVADVYHAVKDGDLSRAEKVRDYFYDKWDIIIETPKHKICIDVKTALTKKQPQQSWDFLYPVVQAQKPGKDYTILAYCMYKDDKWTITKLTVIGYCDNKKVDKCRVIKAGQLTKFGTVSQIDNYETNLNRDYKDIDDLLSNIKNIG